MEKKEKLKWKEKIEISGPINLENSEKKSSRQEFIKLYKEMKKEKDKNKKNKNDEDKK